VISILGECGKMENVNIVNLKSWEKFFRYHM
jgi:hypothetical protein